MNLFQKIKNIYTEKEGENFLKSKDYWVCIIFDRPFSIPIIRLMQKFTPSISPNTVSLFSMPFPILAGYFFASNKLVFGSFFYFIYFIIDCIDGKWARLINKSSKIGMKLDYYICVFGNIVMYLGLFYSQYYLNGEWFIGSFLLFSHYVITASIWLFLKQPYYNTIFQNVISYYTLEEEGFGTFFLAPLFNVVNILFPFLVILQFFSFIILFFNQEERPNVKKRFKEVLLKI